jgi:Pyridoxamine 5'-phosphate oxidase
LLDPEVADQLASPGSVIIGTVDADGNPWAGHGHGVRLVDGDRLRVVINGEEPRMVTDLASSGVVAVAVTDVISFRSIQVKGRVVAVEPASVEDRMASDAWMAAFFADIHESDGTPVPLLERLRAREYLCLVLTIDELYDQTPGPQAGTLLGSAAS